MPEMEICCLSQHVLVFEHISVLWAVCYMMENARSFYSIWDISTHTWSVTVRRWGNFRNCVNLASNLLLIAAYVVHRSDIRYSSTLWALAVTASLLKSVQSGLMWRQTGPIIISMSYMLKAGFIFCATFAWFLGHLVPFENLVFIRHDLKNATDEK